MGIGFVPGLGKLRAGQLVHSGPKLQADS